MEKTLKAGLIGCGDYLRWEIEKLNSSEFLKVKSTFDIDKVKSENRARQLNASVVDNLDDIFNDDEIDILLIFTPPWVRIDLFEKAAKAKKHIITTKPLAPNIQDASKLRSIINESGIKCAVFYGRTGNAGVEKMKQIFETGEIGKLAFYKEDWFHHYPQWNNWATDRTKNGGPFMDAMVHNLNKARYLINSPVSKIYYSSENFVQNLNCNDTEFLKVSFENGASTQLFITWAADLEVFSLEGNEREHYGISHYITDKGWYVKEVCEDNKCFIQAKKEHEVKTWAVENLPLTPYDSFSIAVQTDADVEPGIDMAWEDIHIMDAARMNS
jgi:predicted dehydrogenase